MHTTLVIGGTGKTGRRVAERLKARDLPVIVASRSGERRFDWNDRATWEPTLEGASAAYVSYFPDLALPGTAELIGAFSRLAVSRGTRRLVLLSGRGEEEAQLAERALIASGADWTVVRCSWFCQNFSESFMLESVLDGELVLPAGDVHEPFVDVEDIADVATAALTEAGHEGRVYELTGPRLLTFAEAVAEIGRATGRPLRFTPVPMDAWRAALEAAGEEPVVVSLLTYLFTEVLDGRNARVTDGVRQALGREPTDFSEFARRTAASGAWTTPSAA